MAMQELEIVMPTGEREMATVLHLSPSGTYAVVKLAGTSHSGTVDVFNVGTGKRATPPRHFPFVRMKTIAIALAADLDAYDPVDADGELRVAREEYHAHFDAFVRDSIATGVKA